MSRQKVTLTISEY